MEGWLLIDSKRPSVRTGDTLGAMVDELEGQIRVLATIHCNRRSDSRTTQPFIDQDCARGDLVGDAIRSYLSIHVGERDSFEGTSLGTISCTNG